MKGGLLCYPEMEEDRSMYYDKKALMKKK